MIVIDHVTVTYPEASEPTLRDVTLTIDEGELVLVVGPTGSGKSTLLGLINGLVPHFTGGEVSGRVTVAGRDTRVNRPRDFADVVGVVPQDPRAAFVTDTVEEELAYGMEQLGIAPDVMRRRVEETLDLLGLAELRDRPLRSLSGGQRQRVAIGAVLTTHPKVLVLDEPTSQLDPSAAEEVLAALQRLVHDLGITVVLAEHRLERVVQYADRVVLVPGNAQPLIAGTPADVLAESPIVPPIVELARLAGWSPVPLSVRDARRLALPLREQLAHATVARHDAPTDAPILITTALHAGYRQRPVLVDVSLTVAPGEIVALMGRNGAGKSTLLSAMVGLLQASAGSVRVSGLDPAVLHGRELLSHIGLVPQDASDLLMNDTVRRECSEADRDAGVPSGTTRALLEVLAPGLSDDSHPRDLSSGQQLSLALAIVLAAGPRVVLLDEPTRGLDYNAKRRLVHQLRDLAAAGHAVLLSTHDVEMAAEVAHRVVVVADGEVVTDGPAPEVLSASPLFAPQIAKVLGPLPLLTVDDVARCLAVAG
jgi:energy-coupling factor transport system ATP-binding protein